MEKNPPEKQNKLILKLERKYQKLIGKQFIHFIHIGKTGGTAIKYALEPFLKSGKYIIYVHSHSFKLQDAPEGEKVFFFLRDPIKRFTSGFYSRQRQGQPRMFFPWSPEEKAAFEYFKTPNQLALALSSTDNEERSKATIAMHSISHVRSHYWDWFKDETYFLSRVKDIFYIGFQETLQDDFEILKRKLQLPGVASLPIDEVHTHRNPTNVDKKLDMESILNLKNWYAKDYEFMEFSRKFIELNHLDLV